MDQVKVGKFIAKCRKEQNMTQMQLAETLGITDRAVSKWENGKTMPDSSIMLELCDVLQISVNDLLNGEVIAPDDYARKTAAQLVETLQYKEILEERLLKLRKLLEIVGAVLFIIAGVVFIFDLTQNRWVVFLLFGLMLLGLAFLGICIKVNHIVGYYRCSNCNHTYKPTEQALQESLCFGDTAVLTCPVCKKQGEHKKVTKKE